MRKANASRGNGRSRIRLLLGVAALVVALAYAGMVLQQTLQNPPPDDFSTETRGLAVELQTPGLLALANGLTLLEVSYQSEMLSNQTALVSFLGVDDRLRDHLPESEEIPIRLFSSGFEVEPDVVQHTSRDSPVAHWTVTPKREGEHTLVLDATRLGRMIMEENPALPEDFGMTNEELLDHWWMKLQVTVYTIWGVSEVVRLSIAGLVALLGFALSYPVFVDLIRNRLKRQKAKGDTP